MRRTATASSLLLSLVLVAGTAMLSPPAVEGSSVPPVMKSRYNVRGDENVDLNCPSISYKFEQGTIRCQACHTIADLLVESIIDKGRDANDVFEKELCENVMEKVELAQRRSGVRYWASIQEHGGTGAKSPKKSKSSSRVVDDEEELGLNVREDERVGDTIEGSRGKTSRRVPLTFHTKREEKTLPCASFFLKRYCYELLEANSATEEEEGEDDDEVGAPKCFAAHNRAMKKQQKKSSKKSASKEDRDEKEKMRDELVACVKKSLCLETVMMSPPLPGDLLRKRKKTATKNKQLSRTKRQEEQEEQEQEEKWVKLPSCHDERVMELLVGREVETFMKYAAVYGNEKFRYVEDHKSAGVFVRNPFAKGNEREAENEFLE